MKTQAFDNLVAEIKNRANAQAAPFLVALDGRSGTGKTTLSKRLGQALGASVILGDDFYSGGQLEEWTNMSPRAKVDHCMDWRRMRKEALEPLINGHTAKWRTFNWATGIGLSEHLITCQPAPIIILDGAFSTRPELSDIVNLSVLLRVPDDIRRQRLRDREGEDFMSKWHKVWDEGEDYYFARMRPDSSFDILIDALDIETEEK